jgi:hypothetical protein
MNFSLQTFAKFCRAASIAHVAAWDSAAGHNQTFIGDTRSD